MPEFNKRIKRKLSNIQSFKDIFTDENGAIDLASVMVGVIVIGLIGGVIAATVFAVIPWTQDNAAKQQLDAINVAENAYMGLSSAVPTPLPTGTTPNSFGNSAQLKTASLLQDGPRYCATTPTDGKSYTGYSQSSSGTIWSITDKNIQPVSYTGTLPAECQFITAGIAGAVTPPPPPYVDPTPSLTTMTFKCDVTTTVRLPINTNVTGTLTYSDGQTEKYAGISGPNAKTMLAGVTYQATFDGTYLGMASVNGPNCLRSLDHWGSATGVTSAAHGFDGNINLTSVPDHIPTTITDMSYMFENTPAFNNTNVGNWDVSNVKNMAHMFEGSAYNQPLNNWNVSKITDMSFMFNNAGNFNQPLNSWNVSNVTDTVMMFNHANSFNQDLSSWNTAKVKSMGFMFGQADSMKNNVNYTTYNIVTTMTFKCDVTTVIRVPIINGVTGTLTYSDGQTEKYAGISGPNAKTMLAGVTYQATFEGTYPTMTSANGPNCLRSLDRWGSATGVTSAAHGFDGNINLTSVPAQIPTTISNMSYMFENTPAFNNSNVGNWDISNVVTTSHMFEGSAYNQSLNNWNVSKITDMSFMFNNAGNFNQPLNSWNVSNVTDTVMMFNNANSFNQDLSSWNTAKVKSMGFMFGQADSMKNNVNYTTYNIVTTMTFKCDVTTVIRLPISNNVTGTLTYSDGQTEKYVGISGPNAKTMLAGVTYQATFEGTYLGMASANGPNCLRSLDRWGSATGVTTAAHGFDGNINLTSVPAQIPTTITNMSYMFNGATAFNNANVKSWDVSKVTNMSYMFNGATAFNQDISGWNTAAVTNGTFFVPAAFQNSYMPARTSK